MPTSTCRVAPVCAIDQADRPRRRGPSVVNHDVEVLALGRPVAGPRQPAAPVADDQRPLVVREPRLIRAGSRHGILAHELRASSRSTSATALRLAAATNRRVPSRVIAIPPGTGFPLAPAGWMIDAAPSASACRPRRRRSGHGRDRCWRRAACRRATRRARGTRPRSRRSRARAATLVPARTRRLVGQEDLGLVQDGEDLVAGMHGQVDRPAREGDRARPRSAGPRRPGSCRRAGGPSTPGDSRTMPAATATSARRPSTAAAFDLVDGHGGSLLSVSPRAFGSARSCLRLSMVGCSRGRSARRESAP